MYSNKFYANVQMEIDCGNFKTRDFSPLIAGVLMYVVIQYYSGLNTFFFRANFTLTDYSIGSYGTPSRNVAQQISLFVTRGFTQWGKILTTLLLSVGTRHTE